METNSAFACAELMLKCFKPDSSEMYVAAVVCMLKGKLKQEDWLLYLSGFNSDAAQEETEIRLFANNLMFAEEKERKKEWQVEIDEEDLSMGIAISRFSRRLPLSLCVEEYPYTQPHRL